MDLELHGVRLPSFNIEKSEKRQLQISEDVDNYDFLRALCLNGFKKLKLKNQKVFKVEEKIEFDEMSKEEKNKIDFEKQIYLYNLNDLGTPGFEVINPIKIGDVNYLMNRGWIPFEKKGLPEINLVDQNQIGMVMLKIIEIIGEDDIRNLDPETIYFLNKILNKLNLKKIRNKRFKCVTNFM